jgi:glycosyltransferase involved in cell wall biosynthesis
VRIGHCIHGLGLGGAQQVIKHLVRVSDPKRLQHVVYSCEDGILRRGVEEAGATVRIVPRRLPKLDPFWAAALARAMRADRIDVVHTYLFGDSLHGYLAARAAALPVLLSLHINHDLNTRVQACAYRWLLRRTDLAVACSESVRQSYLRQMQRRPPRIEVIANGIAAAAPPLLGAEALSQRLGVEPGDRVIGTVGRLSEQKGLTHLIEAFADVARRVPNARLVLVGDGPLRGALETQAVRLGIASRVCFTGARVDVPALLPRFDVFVLSSASEAMPMALLEAMAAARCIVATAAPGTLDTVTDRREALIVPIGNAPQLGAAIRETLANDMLRRRLGNAARQRFMREFTAERMAASYLTAYAALAGSHTDAQPMRQSGGAGV